MKTSAISVRALPEEKIVLERIAREERRSLSEMMRELVRSEGERRGMWPPATSRDYERQEVRR